MVSVYDGVAWSCSHTLALDAELQQELQNLQQRPISYKNYLFLWTNLLNAKQYHGCEYLAQKIANTLTNVCLILIGRLDIRVKKRQNENTEWSDVALTQVAVNQADFRVFTNLVDLYIDVINASDPYLYADTVHLLARETVRLSYKHPLISGFYKMMRAVLKIVVQTTEEKEMKERNELETKELLSSYLTNILDLIPTFSNELLIACLYLILDEPGISYITAAVPPARTIPAFRIAFTIGLSNLELAYTALTALETWTNSQMRSQSQKQAERTNELLCEIVPYLESYLRSTESVVEMSQDLMSAERGTVKQVNIIDTECTLRNFQRRVLLFLGSLDTDVLSSFVHERSLNTGATWDQKNLLRY